MSAKNLKFRTPSSGVDKEIRPQSTHPLLPNPKEDGTGTVEWQEHAKKNDEWHWSDFFLHPWNKEETNPGIMSTIHVMLFVYVGNLMFNLLVVYSLGAGLSSVTPNLFFIGFISALVQAGLFYLVSHVWTYEKHLPTYLMPGLAWSEFFTLSRKVSLLGAGLYTVFAVLGAVSAGYICAALNVSPLSPDGSFIRLTPGVITNMEINNATLSVGGYAMYAFGVLMVSFVWLYNNHFASTTMEEKEGKLHKKAAKATAITLFVFVLAFQTLGIRYYCPNTYIAAGIYAGGLWNYDSYLVPFAYFIFFPFLMWVCAAILYYVFLVTSSYKFTREWKSWGGPMTRSEMPVTTSFSPASKLLKDRIHVEY